MANKEQLAILKRGSKLWNQWRKQNPEVKIDLDGAALYKANLRGVKLMDASLKNADLGGTNLSKADLSRADIRWANISEANLRNAILCGAKLVGSNLSETHFEGADLTGCEVYAISAWNLKTNEMTRQSNLLITKSRSRKFKVTVDNIKIAQFLHLILRNEEIRDAIDTLTSKCVLILGRFAIRKRKAILDGLKEELRKYNLIPLVFDFERPSDKDFTETIKTLAGLSYFVIADVTSPKSSPLELQATVPDYQIPFIPIIQEGEKPFALMADLHKKYDWALETVTYDSMKTLKEILKPLIIERAMEKRQKLRLIKAQEPEMISGKDFLRRRKMGKK